MPHYRSRTSTQGRNMAGARALWRATGMKDEDFPNPIIAIANAITQFVAGHVHLKDMGLQGELNRANLINCDVPRLCVTKLNTSDRLMVRFLNFQIGFGDNA